MTITTVAADARQSFERNGYVIARSLFTSKEAALHASWIDELAARPPSIGREMVYFEDSLTEPGARVLSRIERFAGYHDGLASLVADRRVLDAVAALLGDEPTLFKEKVNFKIRDAQVQKVPYMLVVGDREVESGAASVRSRTSAMARRSADRAECRIVRTGT